MAEYKFKDKECPKCGLDLIGKQVRTDVEKGMAICPRCKTPVAVTAGSKEEESTGE